VTTASEFTDDYVVTVPAGGVGALPWLVVEPFVRDGQALTRLVLHGGARWLPWRRRARISSDAWALAVHPGVIECLRQGDVLHLGRTGSAGIALSIVRDGSLVLAAGAVDAVPLGDNVEVVPSRDSGLPHGPPDMPSRFGGPVLVRVGDDAATLAHGVVTLGRYTCRVLHGRRAGIPGTDACVAIARDDACGQEVAEATARLLAVDRLPA
jgi:hypothetical protein